MPSQLTSAPPHARRRAGPVGPAAPALAAATQGARRGASGVPLARLRRAGDYASSAGVCTFWLPVTNASKPVSCIKASNSPFSCRANPCAALCLRRGPAQNGSAASRRGLRQAVASWRELSNAGKSIWAGCTCNRSGISALAASCNTPSACAADARKSFKKFRQRITARQIVEHRLDGNPGAGKHRRAARDFGIDGDGVGAEHKPG